MVSVKQSRPGATSLFHILFAALLVSLLVQPACARAINADRRLLAAATDKVTKLVANKDVTGIVASKEPETVASKEPETVANKEHEMEATEDKPMKGTYWGGGGGYGHGYGNGWGNGGGGWGHGGGGWGHGGGGGWGRGGGGWGRGGGCCDEDADKAKP